MRIINLLLYIAGIMAAAIAYGNKRGKVTNQVGEYIYHYRYLLLILFAANTISFGLTFVEGAEKILITREDYGGEERQVPLLLQTGDSTEEMVLPVKERQYDEETVYRKMREAFAYLDSHLAGENESLHRVRKDLEVTLDYEKFPFDVEVQPLDYSLIDEKGMVRNSEQELIAAGFDREEIENGILTSIKIILSYGEIIEDKTYPITIVKREQKETERLFSKVEQTISAIEKTQEREITFEVPASIEGVSVVRTDTKGVSPVQVLVFGFVIAVLLVFREKEQLRQAERMRRQKLLRSYPWFVNEMVLMLGAGMQVKHIFAQMLSEYAGKEPDDREPLMKELRIAQRGFELGMPEEQIYYQLGRRLQIASYIKLMTLLEQNVTRGAKGLTGIFEQEEQAALEERKNLARKYGEEAGTKLLGPMILLLVIVMLMIMIPAFMSF